MPNEEKSREKAPKVERRNGQDDHEGSPHSPEEFKRGQPKSESGSDAKRKAPAEDEDNPV